MKTFTVTTDCFCEEYLHEVTNYPRPGLKEKKIQSGDKVVFIEDIHNLYGRFMLVEKESVRYTIKQQNLI